ncbi:MAG: hypothetical protein ACO3YY_07785, partial [Phycisphaerales bacterium]
DARRRERDDGRDNDFAGASFGGGDGVGGGAMQGRRTGGEKVRAGSAGFALGGAGAGGGFVPDGQGFDALDAGTDDRRRDRGGAGRREPKAVDADLEKLAPIPGAPSLYAAGQKFHRGVITFEVELVEAQAPGLAGEDMDS